MKCGFWLLQMVPRDSDITSIKSARSIYYLHVSTSPAEASLDLTAFLSFSTNKSYKNHVRRSHPFFLWPLKRTE